MTDKEKFRKEVEKLKSNLIHGACSSQVAMETRCKEEAYNEVLAILDSMQEESVSEKWIEELMTKLDSMSKEEFRTVWEKYGVEEKEEPVSSIWHDASEKSNEPEDVVIINPDNTGEVLTNCTGVYSGRIWSYTSDLLNLDNPCKICKNLQEEPVSEDLMNATNNYCVNVRKGYPRVMDETDRYICNAFKAGAKWQREHLFKSADGEDLPKLEKDVVVLVDNFGKLIPKIAKRTYHLIEKFVDEDTGEIISIENTNEVGDVINWTEPAIYWLDAELPKLQED